MCQINVKFSACSNLDKLEQGVWKRTHLILTFDPLQCRGGVGACPDEMDSSGSCTNDVSDVSGWKENGQQCVVFTRRFATG